MDGKSRVFRPEAEKIWHEDYQCEYYRGVIIDGEDNIVQKKCQSVLYIHDRQALI